jgi:DNA modification methylase
MILNADARALPLRDGCVQCVVTSPPYWGLRDYHADAQIGLEPTPDAYVAALVAVFREVWRVLRDDGTVWLNLGDSYNSSSQFNHDVSGLSSGARYSEGTPTQWPGHRALIPGLKSKDLVGIPWRVAFALQADGWYLRSDIIWHKPNPMPESVSDRPTKAHEYVFLLAKSARYAYDAAAIAEPLAESTVSWGGGKTGWGPSSMGHATPQLLHGPSRRGQGRCGENDARNKRSVWTIPTMPYAGAHFATMPEALIRPCILAGCPLGGLVLDPFLGSGTVGAVAARLGRRWVGCDLTYHALSQARTAQRGLRFTDSAEAS